MLQTCPKCSSHEIVDKTSNRYYAIAAVLAVIATVLVFFAWGWGFLAIAAMLVSVILTVELRTRLFKCKNCDHEWKGDYKPSGEMTATPTVKTPKATD